MTRAVINKIIPFSCVDGPGNRTAVFLQGCNFRCQYCHNPETIHLCAECGECAAYCKTGALSFVNGKIHYDSSRCVQCDECIRHCKRMASPKTELLSAQETMERIRKNMPYIRGITISGGECTRQSEYLKELLALAGKEGLDRLLDSNGSYPFYEDEELLDLCDGVMLDIKESDGKLHSELTGSTNETVLKNLVFLAEKKKLSEVRTVVLADKLRPEATVRYVAECLQPYLPEQRIRYKIIKYRPMGVRMPYRESLRAPENEMLEKLGQFLKKAGFTDVTII